MDGWMSGQMLKECECERRAASQPARQDTGYGHDTGKDQNEELGEGG